jgi:hypothetical protein
VYVCAAIKPQPVSITINATKAKQNITFAFSMPNILSNDSQTSELILYFLALIILMHRLAD